MKPTDLAWAVELAIRTRRSLFIWGPPGIGKSNIVQSVAKGMNLPLLDLRLALMDSVELRGIPTVVQNGHATITRWAIPEFLPQDPNSQGIIFCDELTAAAPAVQVLAYQLADIRFRGIGESYRLPDGWAVIAASNRQGDRAVSNRMPSALAGRFVHVDLNVSIDDWTAWALGAGICPEIIAFLRNSPSHLYDFDPATWKDGRPFASPRSWENLNEMLVATPEVFALGKSAENNEKLNSKQLELVKGTVGDAAGTQFFLWLRCYLDLPSLEEIYKDPTGTPIPDSLSARHAISCALAHRATKPKQIAAAFTYSDRIGREFCAYTIRDAEARHMISSIDPKTFLSWVEKYKDMVIG